MEANRAPLFRRNPAVKAAYDAGEYTDKKGQHWRRGMDGWFLDIGEATLLARHDDFVALIEKENPEIPGTVWNEPLR